MRRFATDRNEATGSLRDWLFPQECLDCQNPVAEPGQPLICGLCRTRWLPISPPFCPRCQHPTLHGVACRLCADWPAEMGPVRSAVWLDERVRRAIHAFKYQGWSRLAEAFAHSLLPVLASLGPGPLVPVPTDARRRFRRGYDQAEELALALGEATGREVLPAALRRTRRTPSQVNLTPEERRANLTSAFEATSLPSEVILVDDVFTTGATLLSAALVLRESGVARIAGLTFARAEPPLRAASRSELVHTFFGSERF